MPVSRGATNSALSEATPLSAGGSHRTLAEKAYVELHALILSGELAPGERLRIDVLAELLEMSPMPIREALNRLSTAGLVDHAPHRATRVAELSLDDLAEVYGARLALEPLAVRLAAERFTPADEDAARDALRAYDERLQGDPAALWAAHTAFHYSLYAAAGSQWLLRLITPLWETPSVTGGPRCRRSAARARELTSTSECSRHVSQATPKPRPRRRTLTWP